MPAQSPLQNRVLLNNEVISLIRFITKTSGFSGGFWFECLLILCYYMSDMEWYYVLYFIVGTMFGSFLNAYFWRVRQDKSVWKGRSICTHCCKQIKWFDNMDMVLVVVDSTRDPLTQVNLTILGNLDARGVPFLIVANKADLKQSQLKRVEEAFQNYRTVGISARTGHRLENLYDAVLETV